MNSQQVNSYLGIGSNLGNRIKNLEIAAAALSRHPHIKINSFSSFYETEPVGYKKQGWFINQVIQIETSLSPLDLLKAIQKIEDDMGRKRVVKWGPRTIDIDILLYADLLIVHSSLTIPHPHLTKRRFVLVPLAEIAPSLIHPSLGESISKILIDSSAVDLVKKV
ncbi:MAG: 2-amino-4-hydroxy-6-hydroxymethyldihydropteridine diphosphokinase [bacterium]